MVGFRSADRLLTLDPAPEWAASGNHYVEIRCRDGSPWGPVRVIRGASDAEAVVSSQDAAAEEARRGVTLDDALARSDTQEPAWLAFSPGQPRSFPVLITDGDPDQDGEHIHLSGVMDAAEVYATTEDGVPPLLQIPDLYSSALPVIAALMAQINQRQASLILTAGWQPAKNAASYEAQVSYDEGETWIGAYEGDRTTFEAVVGGSDGMRVRVRGVTPAGARGAWSVVQVEAPSLIIGPTTVVLEPIDYDSLAQDVRGRIEHAQETAQTGVDTAEDALEKAGTALDRALESLGNDAANAAAIISESSVRITQNGATATRVDGVVARTDSNAAAVISEQTARTSADGAIGVRIDTVVARTDAGLAAVTSEQTARVSADGALGQRIDTVSAKTDAGLAAVTSEQTARVSADGVIGQRIDTVVARTDAALAGVTSEQTARVSSDGVLAQRIDSVTARTDAALAGVSSETSARITADGAIASRVDAVQAQTDRGTASGRMTLQARSDISGVSARFETLLATQVGGQLRGAGFYINLMPDGSSRTVFDTNSFFITSNGSTAPAFSFDGQTLTIPSLRVTQQAILPGAASETRSLPVQNVDPGASSDSWREIPGTAFEALPDTSLWSVTFSGVARTQISATGSAQLYLATSIQIAIGIDGVPAGPGMFLNRSVGSGQGVAPIPNSDTTELTYSAAFLEVLQQGVNRRFSLLYKFKADPGGTGTILYAQTRAVINKR